MSTVPRYRAAGELLAHAPDPRGKLSGPTRIKLSTTGVLYELRSGLSTPGMPAMSIVLPDGNTTANDPHRRTASGKCLVTPTPEKEVAVSKVNVYITENDLERLRGLLATLSPVTGSHSLYVRDLSGELNRAIVMKSAEIPADVVTMNSTVRMTDLDTGETMTFTLVFPHAADIDQRRISVLAPIGTAMLGYAVGDTFEWRVPGGLKRMRIEKVLYQPEADGNHAA